VLASSIGTVADGTYQLLGLPSGSYRLRTTTIPSGYVHEWYNGVIVGSAGTTASIGVTAGATTTGIDLALSTGATIAGTVTCPTGGYIGAPTIYAYSASGVLVRTAVNTGTIGPPNALGCMVVTIVPIVASRRRWVSNRIPILTRSPPCARVPAN
jgi:hypothetical protein